jgi:hypothetical protein
MLRNLKRLSVATAVLSLGFVAREDDGPQELAKWIATAAPQRGDQRWSAAGDDVTHQWDVYLRDGAVSVRLRSTRDGSAKGSDKGRQALNSMPFEVRRGTASEGLSGNMLYAEVADGWLISFDSGEWGARLWWFWPDGTTRYKISDDHIVGFVRTDVGLLAIAGIAHGTVSTGRLVVLKRDAGNVWKASTLIDLKYAPEAFFKESPKSIILALTDQLVRIQLVDKKVDLLVDEAFWRGLYPTSIVAASPHTCYVGMRHGVAKIDLRRKGGAVTWLTPE